MRRIACLLLLSPGACQVYVGGLMPVYPSPEDGRVGSLTPTLRWEPFPLEPDPGITAVVYDLRIFESNGDLAYHREGIPASEHQVETPLKPNHRYEWTVRACFRSRGERRVTQWSGLAWEEDRSPTTPVPRHPYLPLRTPSLK